MSISVLVTSSTPISVTRPRASRRQYGGPAPTSYDAPILPSSNSFTSIQAGRFRIMHSIQINQSLDWVRFNFNSKNNKKKINSYLNLLEVRNIKNICFGSEKVGLGCQSKMVAIFTINIWTPCANLWLFLQASLQNARSFMCMRIIRTIVHTTHSIGNLSSIKFTSKKGGMKSRKFQKRRDEK